MKGMNMKIWIALLLTAATCYGQVPQIEMVVDSQRPADTATLRAYVATTPLIQVDLQQANEPWFPTSPWGGYLWYGTNSDWASTAIVTVAGTFTTNISYATFQAVSNTFPASGIYYGGVVMTNTHLQIIEWGRFVVQVLPAGGITASAPLMLGGLGLGTASTNNTGDFATAAQGAKADTALQSLSATNILTYIAAGITNTLTLTSTNLTLNINGVRHFWP